MNDGGAPVIPIASASPNGSGIGSNSGIGSSSLK